MIKYIIFDLDGTLVNSNSNIKNAILEFFRINDQENYDKLRYNLDFNRIANLKDLLINIYGDFNDEVKIIHKNLYQYLNNQNNSNNFIPGSIETIKKIKNNYKLFLSTGSSTFFAKKVLEEGGIIDCFEIIQGSDKISKSEEHLDIFKQYSNDEKFFENSISIGDGVNDELFAKNRNIKFIKIGEEFKSIADVKIFQ